MLVCKFFRLMCESLIFPLQERLDDWKKSVVQMDKDHAKGRWKMILSVNLINKNMLQLDATDYHS